MINKTFTRRIILPTGYILLLLICASASHAQSINQDQSRYMAAARERYNFEGYPSNNLSYDGVLLSQFQYPGYTRSSIDFIPGSPVILEYASSDNVTRFFIEVSVCNTPENARNAMAVYLAHVSSAQLLPSLDSKGIQAGEFGFYGYAPRNRIAWLIFVRGNICIRILCNDPKASPHPDMKSIAERTDRIIRGQTQLKPGTCPTAPVISELGIRSACSAGTVVPIDLDIMDSSGTIAAITWNVGGPGQGYVEKDKNGKWHLHTTKMGAISLTCHILAANGVSSSQNIQITVHQE